VYSVVLPSLSQDLALHRRDKLRLTLSKAFNHTFMVTLPTTLIFYFLRVPIVSILFQRGAFDIDSVQMTSEVLKGYALSIIGLSLSAVCIRYFLAAGKMLVPIVVTIVSSSINICADYILKGLYGAAGLGYGAAIGATVYAVCLLLLVSFMLQISYHKTIRPLLAIVTANIIPCCILVIFAKLWHYIPNDRSHILPMIILACVIGLCAAIYYTALRKFRMLGIHKGRTHL
jgi:peptidoglycan biosynthesis protein MviN/MurJ (putative lipid II flippase)